MDIKLIATDLDGTFLNNDHLTVCKENYEAFSLAHQKGVKLAVISGRTKVLAEPIIKEFPFIDYLITSNGAVVYDAKTSEPIDSTLLSSEISNEIFNMLEDHNLSYEIYFNGKCYMNEKSYGLFTPETVSPHIYSLLKMFIEPVKSLRQLIGDKGIEKLNILSLTGEQRNEIEEKICRIGDIFVCSSFPKDAGQNGNLEMTHINANKGYALKILSEKLGITNDNVMTFGDGENDCSMLEYTPHSFAMANGSDYAKKSAKHIADTNENAGVGKTVKKYVLGI